MDDKVDAIIRVKVPKWQIGEEVSIYFPDTMTARGKCEEIPTQAKTCENCDLYFKAMTKEEMQKGD